MDEIKIESNVSADRLDELGVTSWSIWTKEVSEFPWTYDNAETCYFLEGSVTVTPGGGVPVKMGQGDLVIFPSGMSCTWQVNSFVKKHYRFG